MISTADTNNTIAPPVVLSHATMIGSRKTLNAQEQQKQQPPQQPQRKAGQKCSRTVSFDEGLNQVHPSSYDADSSSTDDSRWYEFADYQRFKTIFTEEARQLIRLDRSHKKNPDAYHKVMQRLHKACCRRHSRPVLEEQGEDCGLSVHSTSTDSTSTTAADSIFSSASSSSSSLPPSDGEDEAIATQHQQDQNSHPITAAAGDGEAAATATTTASLPLDRVGLERVTVKRLRQDRTTRRREIIDTVLEIQEDYYYSAHERAELMADVAQSISRPSCLFAAKLAAALWQQQQQEH